MVSDVKLDGERVVVDGSIYANAAEIFLDRLNKGRRRALVHNINDQLIINCGGDYPAGVLIESPVTVAGSLQAKGAEIFLDRLNKGRRRALVHDLNDQLLVNCGGDYPQGVKMWGPVTVEGSILVTVTPDIHLTVHETAYSSDTIEETASHTSTETAHTLLEIAPYTLNLVEEILTLKAKVKVLEDKIKN